MIYCLSPPLKMDQTFAIFNKSGKSPVANVTLTIISVADLMIQMDMSSWPGELSMRELIALFITKKMFIGLKINVWIVGFKLNVRWINNC